MRGWSVIVIVEIERRKCSKDAVLSRELPMAKDSVPFSCVLIDVHSLLLWPWHLMTSFKSSESLVGWFSATNFAPHQQHSSPTSHYSSLTIRKGKSLLAPNFLFECLFELSVSHFYIDKMMNSREFTSSGIWHAINKPTAKFKRQPYPLKETGFYDPASKCGHCWW